jgi:leucyl-tRNA synthetase
MDERYNFREIEAKWQARWESEKTFRAPDDSDKPKFYVLEMFPYPSGAGLSVGHVKNYGPTDAFCRFKSMRGFNVLHPMGWDAFGQPAENEAIKRGRNPREMVPEYAANYRRTLKRIGATYDWDREINSSLPEYYRWTQWFFLLLFHRGLAYRSEAPINWCPVCKTGLANEEVKEGRCWRCDSVVEKRLMPQWFFKITEYAERLLRDLDQINWPEGTKQMQREWIGRSEGAEVDFPVIGSESVIRVFTTRPDTLWGATFMVLAPEHPLVETLTAPEQRAEVKDYIQRAKATTEIDRQNAERAKTGVFIGAYALNPVNGEQIPIWIADYVLMGYGTGAIMAVPAHDQRDFEFARKYGLKIELVYATPDGPSSGEAMTEALPHEGVMRKFTPGSEARVDGYPFEGLPNNKETVQSVIQWLEEQGVGEGRINYKLRDWLISRQRYWGAPIPIVHCSSCGVVAVPEDQLPVLLPDVDNYQPSGTGESPLATIPEFVHTTCPQCGGTAKRETDTMGGFACSSWYFLRFADPHNQESFASREKIDFWLPVDLYTGGKEHSVMHLLYARFWVKVMYDAGLVGFTEPFHTLRHQGDMLALTLGRRPREGEGIASEEEDETVIDWIILSPKEREPYTSDHPIWQRVKEWASAKEREVIQGQIESEYGVVPRWTRMSKSKGNVVVPDEVADRYGADSLRVYEMFVAPFEDPVQWSEDGIYGSFRYVNRVWRWIMSVLPQYRSDWQEALPNLVNNDSTRNIRRKVHQTNAKVADDIENFRFNTAIAALMELVNDLYAYRPVDGEGALTADPVALSEALENLVLMLAPFTPHLSDEIWERMGKSGTTYHASWPDYDPSIAAQEEITLVVQVNGKLRDRIQVPANSDNETLKQIALASSKVQEMLNGKQIRNVIVVPGKLVNVVIG